VRWNAFFFWRRAAAFIEQHGQARAKLDEIEFTLDGLNLGQSLQVRTSATLQLVKLCQV